MAEAFLCGYVRTPIARFGGALSQVRADDLAAQVILEEFFARRSETEGGRP